MRVDEKTNACRSSPAGCDYGMRFDSVWDLTQMLKMPLVITLPYFGHNPAARASLSIIGEHGQEVFFDEPSMTNAFYIEPFTGLSLRSYTDGQHNLAISKSTLTSKQYVNIFSGDYDLTEGGDETLFLPLRRNTIDIPYDSDSEVLLGVRLINTMYLSMFISLFVSTLLCGVGQIFCGWKMRKKILSGEVSKKPEKGLRKSKQLRDIGKDELCNSKLLSSIPGQPISPDVRSQTDIGSERFSSRTTCEESNRESHAAMDSTEPTDKESAEAHV